MKFSSSLSSLLVLLPLLGSVSAAGLPRSATAGLVARQFGGFGGGFGGFGGFGGNQNDQNNDQNNQDNNQDNQNNDQNNQNNNQDNQDNNQDNQNDNQDNQNNNQDNQNNNQNNQDNNQDNQNNDQNNQDNNQDNQNNNQDNQNNNQDNQNNNQDNQNNNQDNQNNQDNNNNNNNDPQTSLTLDPAVIAAGFANNGQDVPAEGQVASLTSTNNFINFCLTVPNLPITNGEQIRTGSCNPAPIGVIPSVDKMPSSKFVFPQNGATVPSDEQFTIRMAINNLQTGNFVNAQANYYAAPQQLNNQGIIIGHSHVVVELLDGLDQTTPTDPQVFAFFKGLNAPAQNGELTADVTDGLPAGAYRLCSINAAANHQPAIAPVAQHGSLDDCVYFTATPGGAAADNGNNNDNNNNNNNNQDNNNQDNNNQDNNNQDGNNQDNNNQDNNNQDNNNQDNNNQDNNNQDNNNQQQQGGGFGGQGGNRRRSFRFAREE